MGLPKPVRITSNGHQTFYFYKPVSKTRSKESKGNRNVTLGINNILLVLGTGWEYRTTKTNRWYENTITGEKLSRRKALDKATKELSVTGEKKYSDFYKSKLGAEISVFDNLTAQFKQVHARYPEDSYLLIAYGEVQSDQIGTDLSAQLIKGNKFAWSYILHHRIMGKNITPLIDRMRQAYDDALTTIYSSIKYLQLIRVHFTA